MNNKNGFTLIELLACIALLAILVAFVVPKVYEYLSEGYNKTLSLQEKNIEDAAKLYVEDYCTSPINSNYNCTLIKNIDEDGFATYSGIIRLRTLVEVKYIDSVVFRSESCDENSYIEISGSKYSAYLNCGNGKYTSKDYESNKLNGAV